MGLPETELNVEFFEVRQRHYREQIVLNNPRALLQYTLLQCHVWLNG